MALAPRERPVLSTSSSSETNTATSFTVHPNGGTFRVGNSVVVFPANSICDPATSTYGTEHWDDSCRPLASPITISAIAQVKDGRTQVDFSPSLRFVPSDSPSRWVWLYMNLPSLAGHENLEAFKIFYTPTLDGPTIDESIGDSTLRTYVDRERGVSLRRVKHFSGYAVSTGRSSCDSSTTSCSDSTTTQP